MASRFGTWWQKIKAHQAVTVVIVVVGMLGIALLVVLDLGYVFNWEWAGLGSYIPPSRDSNFQRGKTLWDWLQLLIVPLALAIIALVFQLVNTRRGSPRIRVKIHHSKKQKRAGGEDTSCPPLQATPYSNWRGGCRTCIFRPPCIVFPV
jgi:hypothetical protein